MDENKQPGIEIAQILLWSARFDHREDALELAPNTAVEVSIQAQLNARVLKDESRGVLSVRVSTDESTKPLYRFNFEMIAIIATEKLAPNMSVREYLSRHGGPTLYPFMREAVANVTARGRFGPLWLRPFNFKAAAPGDWASEGNAKTAPKKEGEAKPGVKKGKK